MWTCFMSGWRKGLCKGNPLLDVPPSASQPAFRLAPRYVPSHLPSAPLALDLTWRPSTSHDSLWDLSSLHLAFQPPTQLLLSQHHTPAGPQLSHRALSHHCTTCVSSTVFRCTVTPSISLARSHHIPSHPVAWMSMPPVA